MEAMTYLHYNNVYYGDMKPDNLLIFKDYRIKLGDLGVSLKLPSYGSDSYLKGLTPNYYLDDIYLLFKFDQPVTAK